MLWNVLHFFVFLGRKLADPVMSIVTLSLVKGGSHFGLGRRGVPLSKHARAIAGPPEPWKERFAPVVRFEHTILREFTHKMTGIMGPGHEGRRADPTDTGGDAVVDKEHALVGHFIDVRCPNVRIELPEDLHGPVVRVKENDVQLILLFFLAVPGFPGWRCQ